MSRFILWRLLLMLPMAFIALTVTLVRVQMGPGSAFSSERRLPPEITANLKAVYGFDQTGWTDPNFKTMLDDPNQVLNLESRMAKPALCEQRLLRVMPLIPFYRDA